LWDVRKRAVVKVFGEDDGSGLATFGSSIWKIIPNVSTEGKVWIGTKNGNISEVDLFQAETKQYL
jgi:hypothetical protein